MRLFGSERMAKIMDRMGLKEGEVIQHSMMTKSIERAQKKVEENNFGIRKRLLEYDDVMNAQREVIYKRRKHALSGNRLKVDIANMIFDTCEAIVEQTKAAEDYKDFQFQTIRLFGITEFSEEETFLKSSVTALTDALYLQAYRAYEQKLQEHAKVALPVVQTILLNPSNNYKRVVVPFTDGQKTIQIVADLEKARDTGAESLVDDFEKNSALALIDEAWKDHLRKMDELKQSVQLAVHEQKDPLLIYKFEAFELFKAMLSKVNKELLGFLLKARIPSEQQRPISDISALSKPKNEKLSISKESVLNTEELAQRQREVSSGVSSAKRSVSETVTRENPKIGRNERVTIIHTLSGEEKELKYKQAEPLLQSKEWVLKS
jgi:preprotein translocase subunit SecA